jgi:hypothetical protein
MAGLVLNHIESDGCSQITLVCAYTWPQTDWRLYCTWVSVRSVDEQNCRNRRDKCVVSFVIARWAAAPIDCSLFYWCCSDVTKYTQIMITGERTGTGWAVIINNLGSYWCLIPHKDSITIITNKWTNPVKQSPLWEADIRSSGQERVRSLRNAMAHYYGHSSPPSALIVSQLNPLHNLCKIHFNIAFPSTLTSSKWSLPFRFWYD